MNLVILFSRLSYFHLFFSFCLSLLQNILIVTAVEDDPVGKLVGKVGLQIGFSTDCYLFAKYSPGTKNAEFRCGETSGDPLRIEKSGEK